MTQEDVIDIAIKAGGQVTMYVNHSTIQKTTTFTFEPPVDYCISSNHQDMYHVKFLEAFAKLAAAKEREACEALIDHEDVEAPVGGSFWGEAYQEGWAKGTQAYRDAIKARGEA